VNLSLDQANGQWTLTMTDSIDFNGADLWPYIAEPGLLSQWLPFGVLTLDPRVDGAITVRNPDGSIGKGVVTAWAEGESVGFRVFADGETRGELDNITTLRLAGQDVTVVQQVANPHIAAMVALGWQSCYSALAHLARGEEIPPMPPDVHAFEDFVRQLGLDKPVLEAIPGGTRIRFDRQTLMQPVDKFWSVMTAGLGLRVGDFAPPTFTGTGESGRISILTPPDELEYLTSDGGRVKWRFHEHFNSTRINLQIAVPRSVDAGAVSATWQEHLNAVIARVIGTD
jgi:hypothetical protein